jgi:transcriptional regulator with XRE-family HTH domain
VRDELEARWADLGEFIRAQRELTRMSVRRLAELAGVSNPYLSQIERGLRKPSADVLQQIAKGLNITAEALYVRAGILGEEIPARDTRQVIGADPLLTHEQRASLLAVYESFVLANEVRAVASADAAGSNGAGGGR